MDISAANTVLSEGAWWMCLVMVLAAFTALSLTFDVWEATRISPHDL